MRIEYDMKLDFKDVLIRPKRSVLKSRSEVILEREFRFRNAGVRWRGVPIIAANMDHTGTFPMAVELARHQLLTAMDKFHDVQSWQSFAKQYPDVFSSCFVSVGITEKDFENLQQVMSAVNVPMICLDVANGYTERFVKYLERLRTTYPDKIIMAAMS